MKSKKSGSNNTKKKKNSVMKGNKKTSISNRRRDRDKIGRAPKTRQRLVSKTKPSKRK